MSTDSLAAAAPESLPQQPPTPAGTADSHVVLLNELATTRPRSPANWASRARRLDSPHSATPTRRTIFELVADRPRAVVELAREMPVSRPAVSQHLKVLKDAGLVTDRPVGNRRI